MTTAVWITISICFTLIMLAIIGKYDSPKKKELNRNKHQKLYSCGGCKYQKTVPIECGPCCKCSRIFEDYYEEENRE